MRWMDKLPAATLQLYLVQYLARYLLFTYYTHDSGTKCFKLELNEVCS